MGRLKRTEERDRDDFEECMAYLVGLDRAMEEAMLANAAGRSGQVMHNLVSARKRLHEAKRYLSEVWRRHWWDGRHAGD